MSRKRHGRGEGGIRHREDKGIWVGEVRLTDGGRKTVNGATKTEVMEKMQKVRNDEAAGITGEADRLTLADWLARWLVNVKPTVEPNTYGPYERHCRLHITPHIGPLKLSKLKAAHVRSLYTALTEKGMSAALQRKVGTTLTIALNEAVRGDLLQGNPADKVKKPKAARPEIHPLDPDQAATFLAAAKADRLFAFYRTALDSGARPGELFALTWPDVDFDRGFISITRSLEEISGILRVKETKTSKSRRRVDLSHETMATLQDHRKEMLAAGIINGPVFCDTLGGHLRQSNLHRSSFKPLLVQAGLPGIRLYDLRHTCATLLLLADVPAKVVSERLGYGSITLTLDIYSHVLPTMQKRAADLMGKLLGTKLGSNGGTMAVRGG